MKLRGEISKNLTQLGITLPVDHRRGLAFASAGVRYVFQEEEDLLQAAMPMASHSDLQPLLK